MRLHILLAISACIVQAASAAGQDGARPLPVAPVCAPPAVPVVEPMAAVAPTAPVASTVPAASAAPTAPAAPTAQVAPASDPVLAQLDSITLPDWKAEPATVVPPVSEIMKEYRCASVTQKRYSRTQRVIDVFVYNFPDAKTAYAAYSALRIGSANVVVRGDMSSEDDMNICFLKGTRFVNIKSSVQEDDLSKQAASVLADQFVAKITEHADPPAFLNMLPVLYKMHGTEKIFFGPVATRRFMAIPFIPDLRISESKGAAYADYQFPHPDPDRAKVMIIDFQTATTAAKVYEDYAAKVEPLYKTRPLSSSMQLCKARDSFLLCGHNGTRVFIVAGAKKKLSPLILARQLGSAAP